MTIGPITITPEPVPAVKFGAKIASGFCWPAAADDEPAPPIKLLCLTASLLTVLEPVIPVIDMTIPEGPDSTLTLIIFLISPCFDFPIGQQLNEARILA